MIFNSIYKNTLRKGLGFKFKPASVQRHQPKVFLVTFLPRTTVKKAAVIKKCMFHSTPPRHALPPLVVLAMRYVLKLGAIISGRTIRKWWQKLSPKEREMVMDKLRSKKSNIAFAGTILAGFAYFYYLNHIVEDPITKRKKFIMINQKQMNQIGDFEFEKQVILNKTSIVPSSHPVYRRVLRVANNLILSNMDLNEIKNKVWSVTVVDKPQITNAFVLPNGKIFVFTGMLNICTNDDQLAVVLAHEIAHSILCHSAENMSNIFLIDFLLFLPTLFFWIIFPDVWAMFSDFIAAKVTNIILHLPFSRAIEREADVVGFYLAAKSCYDVREGPVFWAKMKFINQDFPFEWLSTHPSHESRQVELKELLPNALHVREVSKCPPLSMKTHSPVVFRIM